MPHFIQYFRRMRELSRVLVTGASGFIGSRLVARLLGEGRAVRVLARGRTPDWGGAVEILRGDILDAAAMKDAARDRDAVFHLAGKAHAVSELGGDEEEHRASHVEGTRHVLESAAAWGCRSFVYVSSVKAMGEEAPERRDESWEPRPETPYGRAKLEAERLVLARGAEAGLAAACLRLPLVYGPGAKGNLALMLRAVDRGIFPPIAGPGNKRSMVHVDNVVDAALLAASHPAAAGRCFIVADAQPYSTREIHDAMRRGLGKSPARWGVPPGLLRALGRAGDAVGWALGRRFPLDSAAATRLLDSAWYDGGLIARELGYRPRLSLEDAIPDMVARYREGAAP